MERQYFGQRRIEIAVLKSTFGKVRQKLDRVKSDDPCHGVENSQEGLPDGPSVTSAPPQPSFVPVASPPGMEQTPPATFTSGATPPCAGDSAPRDRGEAVAPEASAQGMLAPATPEIASPSQASTPQTAPGHDRVSPATAGGSLAEARRATIQELIKTLQVLKPGAPIDARSPPSASALSHPADGLAMKTVGTLPELKQLEASAQMASRAARSNARIRVQTCPDLPGIQEETNPPAVQAQSAAAPVNAGFAERLGGCGGAFEANSVGWSPT